MQRGLILLLLVTTLLARAGNDDSLRNLLKKNLADTERVNVLNLLCYSEYLQDLDVALPYAKQALSISRNINYYKGELTAYLYLSYILNATGDREAAHREIDTALIICEKVGLETFKVKLLNQKGNLYGDQGDISRSLDYYLQASKVAEKIKDRKNLLGAYANIGICFMSIKQYAKAKEYLRKALSLSKETSEYKNEGNVVNNLGALFLEENNLDSAYYYFKQGEELFTKAGYQRGLGYCAYYLGSIFQKRKLYDKALQYFQKAAVIHRESSNWSELPNIYNCIAEIYLAQKQPDRALDFAQKSLDESLKENSAYDIKEVYSVLQQVYEQKGDYKTALNYYGKYVKLKDSLVNGESTQQMAEMQTKYETDKKEQENKLLQEKNDSNAKTIKQQRYFGIAVGVICVLLIAFAIVIFRSNKQKHRINLELERKNFMIEKQKELVEEKQKEILDSIHYAKRIQRSLLPSEKYITRNIEKLKKS